jgi:hypothetical protein
MLFPPYLTIGFLFSDAEGHDSVAAYSLGRADDEFIFAEGKFSLLLWCIRDGRHLQSKVICREVFEAFAHAMRKQPRFCISVRNDDPTTHRQVIRPDMKAARGRFGAVCVEKHLDLLRRVEPCANLGATASGFSR